MTKSNQDELKALLAGDFGGLLGEVETEDCYRLRKVNFIPDVVFDIGGNIGIFARHARKVFPRALIISVEPDPENCRMFRAFTEDSNTILIEAGIGRGTLYHGLTARNGSGEVYLSSGLGYPKVDMEQASATRKAMEKSSVQALLLQEVIGRYWSPGMKTVMKMDCEGAENSVWVHSPSMDLLRQMDYLAMEVHFYALSGNLLKDVADQTHAALRSFEATHKCELNNVHFWATRK